MDAAVRHHAKKKQKCLVSFKHYNYIAWVIMPGYTYYNATKL